MDVEITKINNGWLVKVRHITHFYETVQEAAAAAEAIQGMSDLPVGLLYEMKQVEKLMAEAADRWTKKEIAKNG